MIIRLQVPEPVYCPTCLGTGLYVGVFEPEGGAVPCLTCQGKGAVSWVDVEIRKFEGMRPPAEDIKLVYPNHTTAHYSEDAVTIKEFQMGIMPGNKKNKRD